jgi:hypothetical protein
VIHETEAEEADSSRASSNKKKAGKIWNQRRGKGAKKKRKENKAKKQPCMSDVRDIFDTLHGSQGKSFFAEVFQQLKGEAPPLWQDPSLLTLSGSAGKGGSFFVRSKEDPTYMVKSLTKSETQLLKSSSFVQEFVTFILENPGSLLMKMRGVYRTKQKVYFMLIENVLHFGPVKPERIFDLKGSLVHRRAAADASIRLDCDWLDSHEASLYFSPAARNQMMDQMEKDTEFLARFNLMDYSLLVGIIACPPGVREEAEARSYAFVSEDRNYIYLLAIIDYLQDYNAKKKLAHAVKSKYHDAALLSTVSPPLYKNRFVKFMAQHVLKEENALASCWSKTETILN